MKRTVPSGAFFPQTSASPSGSRVNFPDRATPPEPRTDLACEAGRHAHTESEERIPLGASPVVITRRREEGGSFVTVACGRFSERGESELSALSGLLARELTAMAEALLGHPVTPALRLLIVGLGNADMTPDAIGPGTVRRLTATRHLRVLDAELYASLGCCELSTLSPGVLGQTGLESAELVRAAISLAAPELVVAVDALAARSCTRLASTVQLSDSGIAPGSGIGNHRAAINAAALGVPVIGLGVPTVVDSATLVLDALTEAGLEPSTLPDALEEVLRTGRSFIVSPRDADRLTELTCGLLSSALEQAFGIEREAGGRG